MSDLLRHCVEELDALNGSIFVAEKESESFRLLGAVGVRENYHCGESVAFGEGVSGGVAQLKTPLIVSGFSPERGLIARKEKPPVDTFMSFPILNGSSVLAVMNLTGRKAGNPFSESDLEKLRTVSEGCRDVLNQIVAQRCSSKEEELDEDDKMFPHGAHADLKKYLRGIGEYNASILRCLSQYVVIFDRKFNITYCNKEKDLDWLFSAAEGFVPGKPNVLDMRLDVERDKLKGRLEDLLRTGTPFCLNNIKITDSPEPRVVNAFFSPFSSSRGDFLGGLLLLDDDTRNYEIRQRLIEAERFSLIGSLTSMITHEVNNPLDGVIRLINLSLAQVKEEQPVKQYLEEAKKGLSRIASLVRSLLNFSHKSVLLDAEFTPLNNVIDNALSIMRNKNENKDISIQLRLAPDNPDVRTNDFYQIIANLLSNSFDAITADRGNIIVETRIEGNELHLTVQDDGCGIPREARKHIFEAFWTTKEYGRGTGLGLAIVKRAVAKYDGKIEMQSEENIGTKIHLAFLLGRLKSPNADAEPPYRYG